jgi:hypothetical protein
VGGGGGGVGRPADFSDVTGDNIAAGFDFQNWGATAPESSAGNTYVGSGGNSLFDTGFRQGTQYWNVADNSGGTLSLSVLEYASGIRIAQAVGAGFTAGQYLMIFTSAANWLPVQAGDRVGLRALLGGASISSLNMRMTWLNDAGGVAAYTSMPARTSGILTGAGETEFFTEESLVGVAPAGATKARIDFFGYCTGASPRLRLALPTLAIIPPGQLVAPPLSRGFDASPGADPTADNIAGGFDGQGALATLDETGTGDIADNATFESLVLLDTTSRAISGSNLYTEIESGVYNKKFAASLVRISWHVKSGKTSTGANFTQVFKLYRGGVAIAEGEFSHWTVPDFNQSWFGSMVVAGVPAGNSTWQLRQRCYTGGSTGVVNVTATYTQFIVEEIKK